MNQKNSINKLDQLKKIRQQIRDILQAGIEKQENIGLNNLRIIDKLIDSLDLIIMELGEIKDLTKKQ